ncbi:hypothetical protein IJ098_03630 [Candidatus Saccharibacteria bacterium]|nr:hypothetical protein [Candidatus Saccharibacteria bacterium]
MPKEEARSKTPVKKSISKSAHAKSASVEATSAKSASVEKPPVASRGMFIDFAPGRSRARVSALNEKISKQKSPDELPARRPTPDRPIDRPPVPRPPRSRVPVKRKVGITTGNMPQMETPTRVIERTTIVATTDNMPEISESRRNLRVAPRRPTPITRSGAVVMPSAPSAGYTGSRRRSDEDDRHRNSSIGEDGFFKDSSPLMSDADLAIALAGFADDSEDDVAPLTDNLSREATEFAEEIDALTVADALEDLEEKAQEKEMEDFVSEPKTLFDATEKDAQSEDADDSTARTSKKNTIYRSLYDREKSPFLASVTVEKRPLSGATPATEVMISGGEIVGGRLAKQAEVAQKEKKPLKFVRSTKDGQSPEYRPVRATKNVYAKRREAAEASEKSHDTIIITPEEKGRNVGLVIAILLTIVLGAGVGALVYLIFF